jgi:hypothetical protein
MCSNLNNPSIVIKKVPLMISLLLWVMTGKAYRVPQARFFKNPLLQPPPLTQGYMNMNQQS